MNQEIIHVYLMPGMAASSSIFEHIKLPQSQFKIHLLEWFLPLKNESIESYAQRMAEKVDQPHAVLLGVSFGGVLVQEMSKFLSLKKLIIVSTVKKRSEFPKRMKVLKVTGAYYFIPTRLVKNVEALAKYAFGETITKRVELYKKYLSMNNKAYLDWAIKEMICWKESKLEQPIIHIHGDKDAIFPIANIQNCIRLKGGTHIMIINKYKWFNENLPKLIMS